MRTLLKVVVPVEAANAAIREGRLQQTMRSLMERVRPEAAYFLPEQGRRAALIVFDLKDPSEIPQIAEPLFLELNASVEFVPVMNADELRAGLQAAGQQSF